MKKVLVIHPDDRSTDMLKAVYEGKGYDVISDPMISDEEVVEQIKSHDKIIMLGHGTPYGLVSWNRTTGEVRYVINDSHAELLKTKETYSMWCHSDEFFESHGMKRIILERYNANDPVTWFNRRNIFIL